MFFPLLFTSTVIFPTIQSYLAVMLKVSVLTDVSGFKQHSRSFHMNREKLQTCCVFVSLCTPASPHVFGCPVSYYCVSCSKLHADFLLSELCVRILPSTFLDSIRTKTQRGSSPFCSDLFGERHLREAENWDRCWECRMTGKWGRRGETECWSEKVKGLLFFCLAPVARPLLPPPPQSVMLTGGKGQGENAQKLCVRVRVLSLCFYANLHVFCVLICLLVKKRTRPSQRRQESSLELSN